MPVNESVVGLDIGRHTVKAVWAEAKRGAPAIRRVETLRLPLDGSDPASVIGPWAEQLGLARHPCVLGIGGQQAMFQPFAMSEEDARTPEQAASMEVVKYNEMASETMVYGFSPLTVAENDRRVLLCMARPSVLDDVMNFARAAGLSVVDIVPTPVAMFNALEAVVGAHDEPYLYVNVGHSATEIAVGNRKGLLFARAFSGGGQMFTDAVARRRNLSTSQAEQLKVGEGALTGEGELGEALRGVADIWLSEVRSCLSVYSSLYSGPAFRPARVILAGGGAALPGLPEYVEQTLELPAQSAGAVAAKKSDKRLLTLAVATGLSMAGAGEGRCAISLLPEDIRDELMFRRQKPYWIAAGVAAALILAVSYLGGYWYYKRQERILSEQESKLQRSQRLVSQIESIKERNERIQTMAAPVRELVGAGPLVRDLVALVADSKAPEDWISMISDADYYFASLEENSPQARRLGMRDPKRNPKKGEVREEEGFRRVMIAGYTKTPNLSTVKALITRLTAAQFVESADLIKDDEVVDAEARRLASQGALGFVIDVKIAQP